MSSAPSATHPLFGRWRSKCRITCFRKHHIDVSSDTKDMFADVAKIQTSLRQLFLVGQRPTAICCEQHERWCKHAVATGYRQGVSWWGYSDKMKVTWILITLMGSPQAEIASANLTCLWLSALKAVLINQSEDHNRTVACLPIIKDGTEPKEDIHFTE